jgi:hypothetical protein
MKNNHCILKLTVLICAILFSYPSFGQKNYLPGKAIQKNGDTLSGFIDYRNWEYNPYHIDFKENLDAEKQVFVPISISGFVVLDEYYKSGIVNTEISPRKTNDLLFEPAAMIKVDTVFLQALVRSKKSLYFYNTITGNQNFYIYQDGQFDLLIYKRYFKMQNDNKAIVEKKNYIGQLTHYLQDCPSINSKMFDLQYKRKNLERVFLFYAKCTKSKVEFQKKKEKSKSEFGLVTGFTISTLKFEGEQNHYLTEMDYPGSFNFTMGLFYDAVLSRNMGKWSIYNEAVYTTYNFEGEYSYTSTSNNHYSGTTQIKYSYIKILNLLQYKQFVGKDTWLVFNAGISNGFSNRNINLKEGTSTFYSSSSTSCSEAVEDARNYEQGIVFGTGVKGKKISLLFRYERGNGMSTYKSLSSATRRYYLLLGFVL